MKASIHLPGTKIIIAEDYKSPSGTFLPEGLMLSIRSLELTFHRKNLKLLAIRNQNIIRSLYEGIEESAYLRTYKSWDNRIVKRSLFYYLKNNDLEDFLQNAKYRNADDIYKMLTENQNN